MWNWERWESRGKSEICDCRCSHDADSQRYWPAVCFSYQLSQELQIMGDWHLPWETTGNVSFEQGISKGDAAVLMKGLGTWSGQVAPGLFCRQIGQNVLTVK